MIRGDVRYLTSTETVSTGRKAKDPLVHRFVLAARTFATESEALDEFVQRDARLFILGAEDWLPDLERARECLNRVILELGGTAR